MHMRNVQCAKKVPDKNGYDVTLCVDSTRDTPQKIGNWPWCHFLELEIKIK